MKIKCPSCTTIGRVPDGKIPAGGANIRCPSCSFVFYVGGPDGINVIAEEVAAAEPPGPAATDDSAVARVRAAAEAAVEAQRQAAPATEPAAASAPASAADDATSEPAGPAEQSSRAPKQSGAHVAAAASGFAGYGGASGFAGYGGSAAAAAAPAPPVAAPAPPVAAPSAPAGSSLSDSGLGIRSGAATTTRRAEQPSGSSRAVVMSTTSSLPAVDSQAMLGRGAAAASPAADPVGAPTTPPSAGAVDPNAQSSLPRVDPNAQSSLPRVDPNAQSSLPRVDPNAQSSLPGADGASRRRGAAWKVRNALGITYDFPDTPNLRRWLESRPTLDDLLASNDGGTTWRAPAEYPELADVRASGIRVGASTESVRAMRATGSVRTVGADGGPSTGPVARVAQPTAAAAPAAEPPPVAPPPASEASAANAAAALTDRMAAAARGANAPRRESSGGASAEPPSSSSRKRLAILGAIAVAVAVVAGGFQFVSSRAESGLAIPNTPAGTQLRWVLSTIQGGSELVSNSTIEERFSPSVLQRVSADTLREQLEYYDSWRDEYRPIRFARPPTPTLIEVVLATNGGDTGVIRVETEPAAPHRLVGLNFRGAD